ncbi:MAG: type II toxin-antitoxin system VapC family toxin [Planctomycetes bacterium]|nr:type II toxin-antitoxin system VapC family toxin [Planctomycetota bacterium]
MTKPLAYPDTCVLVPLFFEEKGTHLAEEVLIEFTKSGTKPLLISELTRLEFCSSIAKLYRNHLLVKEQANDIIDVFEITYCSEIIPLRPIHFHMAHQWIREMTSSLRTFDALHLAMAQEAGCTLITADKQLAAAAALMNVEHYFLPRP